MGSDKFRLVYRCDKSNVQFAFTGAIPEDQADYLLKERKETVCKGCGGRHPLVKEKDLLRTL